MNEDDAERVLGALMLELQGFERELLEAEENGAPLVAGAARREMRRLYRAIRQHSETKSLVLPRDVAEAAVVSDHDEIREAAAECARNAEAARRRGVSAREANEHLFEMRQILPFARAMLEDAQREGLDLVAESAREVLRTLQEQIRRHCAETGLAVPQPGVPEEEA